MPRRISFLLIASVTVTATVPAQVPEWSLSAAVRGSLTTSSKLYRNPESPSPELRTVHTPFTSVWGAGIELRVKRVEDNFFLALSVEYVAQTEESARLDGSLNPPRWVPVTDGYRLVPIEINGSVYIPLGSPTWKLWMGGGVGLYYGERVLTIAGISAEPVGSRFGFGIQVATGLEYRVMHRLSVTGGMKFRDPEINVVNKFTTASTVYNGTTVNFPKGDVKSRVSLDGMSLNVGIIVDLL